MKLEEEHSLQVVLGRNWRKFPPFLGKTESRQTAVFTLHSHHLQLVQPGKTCHIPLKRSLSLLSVAFYRSRFGGLSRPEFQFENCKVGAAIQNPPQMQLIKPNKR